MRLSGSVGPKNKDCVREELHIRMLWVMYVIIPHVVVEIGTHSA